MTDGSESDDNRFEEVGSFTTSDGLRLRSAISGGGDRPALVLVHGWTQDLRTWDRVVHELHAAGETGRILRYDHRGHGGSDAAPLGAATLGRAADDLAELLTDRVPDGLVVLAGHSMGDMTLMALAERHPDLVAQRMRGVAFMGTASDDMTELTLGIGGRAGRAVARAEQVLARYAARLGHRAPVDRTGDARTAPNRRRWSGPWCSAATPTARTSPPWPSRLSRPTRPPSPPSAPRLPSTAGAARSRCCGAPRRWSWSAAGTGSAPRTTPARSRPSCPARSSRSIPAPAT